MWLADTVMPPTPHRLPRNSYCGHVVVAITACIRERRPLFNQADAVNACIEALRIAVKRSECTVPIYCFMPEHLHLVLRGTSGVADAWAALAAFKQRSGFWIAGHYPEHSWQKDFWDHVMRGSEDVRAHICYVANNPVRRGLVTEWNAYPFTGSIGHDVQAMLEGSGDVEW